MAVGKKKILYAAIALIATLGIYFALRRPFPSDRVPEGAYMRIARAVVDENPKAFFAYLETDAQWACFTMRDMRKKASERIAVSYPEPQRSKMLEQYRAIANAPDGSDVFATLYAERNWSRRLRKDLSGVAKVEVEGERASVVTTQGTRWPFRRRDNGIWGITIFTSELVADSEKASRDLAVVSAAADDYDRARSTH